MVDAEARVARQGASLIVPEGVEPGLARVNRAQRVGPALIDQSAKGGLACRLEQRVAGHRAGREGVAILGDDIVIACEDDWTLLGEKFGRARREPLHPAQFVGEFVGPDGVAVGQVDRGDDQPVRLRLDIAAVAVVGIAGEPDLAQHGSVAAAEDGDPVEALLAMPHRAIARRLHVTDRERFVGAFEFLETDDIGLLAREIFEQPRHACADPVNVEGYEFHEVPLPVRVEHRSNLRRDRRRNIPRRARLDKSSTLLGTNGVLAKTA